MALSTPCVVPATTAPMPMMAYTPGWALQAGIKTLHARPKLAPRVAPINNEGAKIPPDPPPPNVPELGSDTDKPLTNRELVKLHQSQVQCSSCHKKMDSSEAFQLLDQAFEDVQLESEPFFITKTRSIKLHAVKW